MDLENGDQPFSDEAGNISAVENGEIYNAVELRDQLLARGHSFSSHSDAEIIPHLIEEWGLDGIERLRGMFALAIHDDRYDRVHLVRDRMGEKPLYVYRTKEATWFSSELRALIKSGCVAPQLELRAVSDFLLHGFIPEGTVISGIEKVAPGTIVSISTRDNSSQVTDYWRASEFLGSGTLEAVSLSQKIEESISLACTSDVPVGVALSGGLDSGLVAAVAAQYCSGLQAVTVGYDTPSSTDETHIAKSRARSLGIEHTLVTVGTDEAARGYRVATSARDEPIADIAGPSYLALAETFRSMNIPVLLSGQGGDELFWGYPWVRMGALMSMCRRVPLTISPRDYLSSVRHSKAELVNAGLSFGGLSTLRRIKRLQRHSGEGDNAIPLFPTSPGYAALRKRIQKVVNKKSVPDPVVYLPLSDRDPGAFMIAVMQTYLRTNGLAQLDRLTMHASVEARTPLVDYRLVEYVLGSQGVSGAAVHQGKGVLAEAARIIAPRLPSTGRKQGFTPPVRAWLKNIWKNEKAALEVPALQATGLFENSKLRSDLSSPFTRIGQVDALALRLLTLEMWWSDLSL